MSIRQYRALAAVGEHGSFARAADALNLTQSALSAQIAALETTLGAQLFDRRRRPPQLTQAGRIALRHADAIIARHEELADALRPKRPGAGELRLGVVPSVLTTLLLRTLMRLRDVHPDLMINVTSDLSGQLLEGVKTGALDAALMQNTPEPEPGLVWREAARQEVIVVAPPQSTETDLHTLFAAWPYIRFKRDAWVAPRIEARLADLELEPRTHAEIESIEAIHELVSLDFGISILPDIGPRLGDAPALRVLRLGDPPIIKVIGLLSRADTAKRAICRIVADAVVEVSRPAD